MKFVASLSQGRIAAAQCGLFTHKSVPVIFEPPCNYVFRTGMSCNKLRCKCFLLLSSRYEAFKMETACYELEG